MESKFQQLVDRVITDNTFRAKFFDPTTRVAAVKDLGVSITPQLQETLERLDIDPIRRVATSMEGRDFC